MKKLLSIALALLLMLCLVACSNNEDVADDEFEDLEEENEVAKDTPFEFEATEINTWEIVGYNGGFNLHEVNIPAEYEGIEVTRIAAKAFYYNNSITKVTIPNTVTEIGDWAFAGCSYLADVVIPDSVTKIGTGAFYLCDDITSIKLSEALVEIDNYAFYECVGLTSVDIPATVTTIGDGAFWGCTALTAVSGNEGVKELGAYSFKGCTALASLNLTATVAEIGEYAFEECEALTVKAPAGSFAETYLTAYGYAYAN